MHRALVLSVFSSTFLVLTTLSGTTGDPGIHRLSTLQQPSFLNPKEFDDSNQILLDFKNILAKANGGKNPWLEYQAAFMKPNVYDYELSKRLNKKSSKRGWDQFNGGWGKRGPLTKDEFSELFYGLPKYFENEVDNTDELDKRDWNNFQGSWGKRDPPFHSPNDILTKRSGSGKWDKLNGGWG